MATPPCILVQLIHIHGGLKGEIQEFCENVISVGRLSCCTVKFAADEPGVSREHARIQREGNQFKLVDLSSYGTFVNGKPAKEALLRSGDVLEFGPGGPKVSITMEVVASVPPGAASGFSPPQSVPQPAYASPAQEHPRQEPIPAAPPRETYRAPEPPREPYQAAPPKEVFSAQGLSPAQYLVQKTLTPLVVQFGPTIRSFRELPVTLGADVRADFVINHPGIQNNHAQIFFSQNCYCIKDLTGQGLLKVNGRRVGVGVPLKVNDEIECGPQGPSFRFLGEGRLAEVEQVQDEPAARQRVPEEYVADTALTQRNDNFFMKLVKGFKT